MQRPHPPICIGGSDERRTLRTAARFARHWNFVGGTPGEFARKRDVLYAHCRGVGWDLPEIVLSSHVRLGPGGDPGPVADTVAALGEHGLDLAIVVLPPPHNPGVLAPLAEPSPNCAEPAKPTVLQTAAISVLTCCYVSGY